MGMKSGVQPGRAGKSAGAPAPVYGQAGTPGPAQGAGVPMQQGMDQAPGGFGGGGFQSTGAPPGLVGNRMAMAPGNGRQQGMTGSLPPGIDPRAVAANPQGYSQMMQGAKQQEAMRPGSTMLGQGLGMAGNKSRQQPTNQGQMMRMVQMLRNRGSAGNMGPGGIDRGGMM